MTALGWLTTVVPCWKTMVVWLLGWSRCGYSPALSVTSTHCGACLPMTRSWRAAVERRCLWLDGMALVGAGWGSQPPST